MMRVVSYAETVKLVPPSTEVGIDLDGFEAALVALASQGLVRRVPPTTSPTDLEKTAARAAEAIEAWAEFLRHEEITDRRTCRGSAGPSGWSTIRKRS